MDNKSIFNKPGGSSKKITYYIVAALCVAVIGVLAFMSYRAMKPETTPQKEQEKQQTSAVDSEKDDITAPVTKQETDIKENETVEPEPEKQTEPTAQKPYVMPISGDVTVGFSLDTPVYSQTLGDWRIHDALDIAADIGSEVVAVNDGVIEEIKCHDLFGMTVTIKHTDGKKSVYSNLEDSVELEEGQIINQNDVVGKVGETAVYEISDGPHLHFEMSQNGQKIDPLSVIKTN